MSLIDYFFIYSIFFNNSLFNLFLIIFYLIVYQNHFIIFVSIYFYFKIKYIVFLFKEIYLLNI